MKIVKLGDVKGIQADHGMKMIHRVIFGKDIGAKFTAVYNILEEGGKGPYPPHKHPHEHCMYIVKGRGKVTSGGESREVESGDFVYIPGNELHTNENISKEQFHFIGISPS